MIFQTSTIMLHVNLPGCKGINYQPQLVGRISSIDSMFRWENLHFSWMEFSLQSSRSYLTEPQSYKSLCCDAIYIYMQYIYLLHCRRPPNVQNISRNTFSRGMTGCLGLYSRCFFNSRFLTHLFTTLCLDVLLALLLHDFPETLARLAGVHFNFHHPVVDSDWSDWNYHGPQKPTLLDVFNGE